jgi:hypothetical protein
VNWTGGTVWQGNVQLREIPEISWKQYSGLGSLRIFLGSANQFLVLPTGKRPEVAEKIQPFSEPEYCPDFRPIQGLTARSDDFFSLSASFGRFRKTEHRLEQVSIQIKLE